MNSFESPPHTPRSGAVSVVEGQSVIADTIRPGFWPESALAELLLVFRTLCFHINR